MKTLNGSLVLVDEHGEQFAVRFDGALEAGAIKEAIEAFCSLVLGELEGFAVFASTHSDAGAARLDKNLEWIGLFTPENGFHSYLPQVTEELRNVGGKL